MLGRERDKHFAEVWINLGIMGADIIPLEQQIVFLLQETSKVVERCNIWYQNLLCQRTEEGDMKINPVTIGSAHI